MRCSHGFGMVSFVKEPEVSVRLAQLRGKTPVTPDDRFRTMASLSGLSTQG